MKSVVLLVCCAFLGGVLLADEVRLKDGRVLVGKVTVKDSDKGKVLEIQTRDGVVRVGENEVESRRTDEELRKELHKMEKGVPNTPFSHLQLATQARAYGLEPELWRHLDAAVAMPRDAANPGQRSRLDDFLAQLEPDLLARKHRTAKTQVRVHELLAQLPRDASAGRLAAVEELLVREANADAELRTEARRNGETWRRGTALSALARRGGKGADTFLFRTAILDPAAGLRERAMLIARERFDPITAVNYLAPGLMAGNAELRIRTGDAFANLGEVAATKLLVMAGPHAGKALAEADPGMRAHVAFLEQTSYIRDFDVEVAQASFIADPKIDVLTSGVVLDVNVRAVLEERIRIVTSWRSALRRLAGSDPGPQPELWAAWYQSLVSQGLVQPPTEAKPAPLPTTPTAAPKK